jgi:hypothetical protein
MSFILELELNTFYRNQVFYTQEYLDLESRQLFYSGYVLPLIDYCCVVWGNCSNEGLNRILKLQKRTARLILDQDPIAPSEPLFKQLG